jgi:2-isopropylmalate synthase
MIDFSDIDEIRRTVEYCNRIDVHPRHPYVGDLVHTAFSGTHQDAIKKGFAEHRARAAAEGRDERDIAWRVPYLPIDPADIGRSYDAVIRVNSQSGKGGIAYLLETEYGVVLPRRLQIDFSRHVQQLTDSTGEEVTAHEIWSLFSDVYLSGPEHPHMSIETAHVDESTAMTEVIVRVDDHAHRSTHAGVGPVEAAVRALADCGVELEILSLHQSSITSGEDAEAVTLIEYRGPSGPAWVAGRDRSTLAATLQAVGRAADRASRARAV